jgi:pimeloyl-ACP methyl ester carboxylesterase
MKKARSKDGTSIAFDQTGQGPPLILVDGALCYRANGPMAPLAKLLAPRFTVFTYDRRGRGDSTDTRPYAVEREVEDIEALLKEAGGAAFVYGTSSGAALALEAGARLANIRKLALYEAPFIVDNTRPPQPADLNERMSGLIESNRRGDAVKLFMKIVGVPAFGIAMMRLMPVWSKLTAVAHTLPYDFAILDDNWYGKPLAAARWASVKMPTLVTAGGKSPAWMQNAMQALAGVLPSAQHRTLERQNHMVKPQVLAPVLEEFFAA